MGLSEMGVSAQLAREMTPKGYWNPAPMTAPVIKLFDKAREMTTPRGMLPDAVGDEMPVLIKACSHLKLTYEIKLGQYMASQAGKCLWLDVISHCRFSDGLNAYIRENSIKVTRFDK